MQESGRVIVATEPRQQKSEEETDHPSMSDAELKNLENTWRMEQGEEQSADGASSAVLEWHMPNMANVNGRVVPDTGEPNT